MTDDESECSQQTPYVYPGFNSTYKCRQIYSSTVNMLDMLVGNVTAQFVQRGLWNNTLMVFSADSMRGTLDSVLGTFIICTSDRRRASGRH